MSDEDILNELSDQGVTDVSRFFLKKDGQNIKTNTLFITFNTPTATKELKIGYYVVKVQMYVPNPLRCFNCQKFGHSKKFCKNPLACWKAMMGASVLQRPLAVLIARVTTARPPSPALFGYKKKISNALRKKGVSRTVTQGDL